MPEAIDTWLKLSKSLNDPATQIDMLRDRRSSHWEECHKLVRMIVQRAVKQVGLYVQDGTEEEIIQDVMFTVSRKLPEFRGASLFTTWLFPIVQNKVKDAKKKQRRDAICTSIEVLKELAAQETDDGTGSFELADPENLEDVYLDREMLEEVIRQTYKLAHPQYERNSYILQLRLIGNLECKDIAERVNVKPQVVYDVIRKAREYLEEKRE